METGRFPSLARDKPYTSSASSPLGKPSPESFRKGRGGHNLSNTSSSNRRSWSGNQESAAWDPAAQTPQVSYNGAGGGFSPRFQQSPSQGRSFQLNPPPGGNRGGSRRNRNSTGGRLQHGGTTPQLANIKKQWNVERDIPTGTVKNNPFLPKVSKEVHEPSVQLKYQKKQWNTKDIPRGAVAARLMDAESSEDDASQLHTPTWGNEPEWARPKLQPVRNAPSSSPQIDTSSVNATSGETRNNARTPVAPTALKGRRIENPYMQQGMQQNQQVFDNLEINESTSSTSTSKWEPSREIPKGTVKGRLSSLFGNQSSSDVESLPLQKTDEKKSNDDDDPWIIPSQTSISSQVFPGDWGEAVRSKTSQDSDDWDTPGKDWFPLSESNTASPKSTDHLQTPAGSATDVNIADEPSKRRDYVGPSRSSHFEVADEKKMNEDQSLAGHRDADVLELARQKQQFQETFSSKSSSGDVLESARNPHQTGAVISSNDSRDHDVLQAAKDKTMWNASDGKEDTTRAVAPARTVLQARVLAPPPKDTVQSEEKTRRHRGSSPEVQTRQRTFNPSTLAPKQYVPYESKQFAPISANRAASPARAPSPVRVASPIRAKSPVRVASPVRSKSPVLYDDYEGEEEQNNPAEDNSTSNPKKLRKGIFKFFGGKKDSTPRRKNAKGSGRKGAGGKTNVTPNKKSNPSNISAEPPLKESLLIPNATSGPSHDVTAQEDKKALPSSTDTHDRTSTENVYGPTPSTYRGPNKKDRNEDDSVSEMTLPTAFKDEKSLKPSDVNQGSSTELPLNSLVDSTGPRNQAEDATAHPNRSDSHQADTSQSPGRQDESQRFQQEMTPKTGHRSKMKESQASVQGDANNTKKQKENSKSKQEQALDPFDIGASGFATGDPFEGFETDPFQREVDAFQDPFFSPEVAEKPAPLPTHNAISSDFPDPELDHVMMDEEELQEEIIQQEIIPAAPRPKVDETVKPQRQHKRTKARDSEAEQRKDAKQIVAVQQPRHDQRKEEKPLLVEEHTKVDDNQDIRASASSSLRKRRKEKFRKLESHARQSQQDMAQQKPSKPETAQPNNPSNPEMMQVSRQQVAATKGRRAASENSHPVRSRSPFNRFKNRTRAVTTKEANTLTSKTSAEESDGLPVPPRIERTTATKSFNPVMSRVDQEVVASANSSQPPQPKKSLFKGSKAVKDQNVTGKVLVRNQAREYKEVASKKFVKPSPSRKMTINNRYLEAERQIKNKYLDSDSQGGLTSASTLSEDSNTMSKDPTTSFGSSHSGKHDVPQIESVGSVRSQRTNDSASSMGSDIRVLRSILRRPRRSPAPEPVVRPQQIFASYDEKSITDPMQRAGLRLLSAAIIPIQAEVRRFIAMRRALTRMWALIVIQTYVRSWLGRTAYVKGLRATVKLQAASRGMLVRNDLVYKHVCAIEIQRYMRGYLATMRVYEDIYKVTMVQSYIRMKLAMDRATHRMAFIIQIQSIARGWLTRRDLQYKRACAIAIQANWRCFFTRLTYQFDLLDIIIVQSVWRKRVAVAEVAQKRYEQRNNAATLIQSQWRAYDCTMNYLHYLADILIAQSAIRRFLAIQRVEALKYQTALTIQTAARGYIKRRDLIQFYAARKIQAHWRGYVCYCDAKIYFAARKIQAYWRGYVCYCDAKIYFAARMIQKNWRGYVCFRDATAALAARMIQANWRGHVTYQETKRYLAARTIQAYWRRTSCILDITRYFAAQMIQAAWRGHVCYQDLSNYIAARMIQSIWRGYVCYRDTTIYLAARRIQAAWRGHACYLDMKEYMAARSIQAQWRGHVCYWDTKTYLAARKIQAKWRGHVCYWDTKTYVAARAIQAQWRGHVCYWDTKMYLAARVIQSKWRGHVCYWNTKKYIAARLIQSNWRGILGYQLALKHLAARAIQAHWRGHASYNVSKTLFAARIIQKYLRGYFCYWRTKKYLAARLVQATWRGHVCYMKAKKYVAARTIQTAWRGHVCYEQATKNIAARRIQATWRGYVGYSDLNKYLAARKIQTNWRMFIRVNELRQCLAARTIQRIWRGYVCSADLKEYFAARRIQCVWRGFVCYADYMFTIADVVIVQKLARRWLARREAADLRLEKRQASSKTIQGAWRRFFYARKIQRVWRLHAFNRDRDAAAIVLQKNWRRLIDETDFVVMKYEYCAARTIQTYWRRFWYFSNFIIALDCSIQIQAVIRGYLQRRRFEDQQKASICIQTACRVYLAKLEISKISMIHALSWSSNSISERHRSAATTIQKVHRATCVRYAVKLYVSARNVQKIVRGRQARRAVSLYLSARTIQTIWRGVKPHRHYAAFNAARRIQTCWRCKNIRNKFRRDRAAVKIQAFWRCRMLSYAYKLYRSALRIQTKFRSVKARQDVLMLQGERLAATMIQTAWRGFVCYTDYIFTVADIVVVQKIARGYISRNRYSDHIKANTVRRRVEHLSATLIQTYGRGFIARQRYWYTLGCTMQIQSWLRGRLVLRRLAAEKKAIVVVQSCVRRFVARQKYLQRKFILMLIKTADSEKKKTVSAMLIQDSMRSYLEAKRRDRAARVIQRFFLMVKQEVDRMIRAAKKRRDGKKKAKNVAKKKEEQMFEDAWLSAVSLSNLENEPVYRQLATTSKDWQMTEEGRDYYPGGGDEIRHINSARSIDVSLSDQKALQLNRSHSASRDFNPQQEPKTSSVPRLPPAYFGDRPSTILRLPVDDDRSEFSGLTTSSAANFLRMPPSRMMYSKREIDEDMELEEAFIDAEIFSAKERRMADKRGSSKKGSSYHNTGSRASPARTKRSHKVKVLSTTTQL